MSRLLLLLVFGPLLAWAHDPGMSSATLDLGSHDILVQVVFARADLGALHAAADAATAARSIELRGPEEALSPASLDAREIGAIDVEFTLRYLRPAGGITLRSPLLTGLPFGHRQAVTLRDSSGVVQLTELLSAEHDSISLPASKPNEHFPFEPASAAYAGGFAAVAVVGLAAVGVWIARRMRRPTAVA